MARAMGSILRKNKGPQWVIQKAANGGLVYYAGGGSWSDSPLDAKIYGGSKSAPIINDRPDGIPDTDYKLARIS